MVQHYNNPVGLLGSPSSRHRQTPEIILWKGHASLGRCLSLFASDPCMAPLLLEVDLNPQGYLASP